MERFLSLVLFHTINSVQALLCGYIVLIVLGGVDVGRTVWRVADNLEKTLLCKFLFSWAKFLKLDTYICWFSCEI